MTDKREIAERILKSRGISYQPGIGGGVDIRNFEPALTMASGAVAEPIGGLAGLLGLSVGAGNDASVAAMHKVQDALTYEPRTQQGSQAMSKLAGVLRPVGEALQKVSQVPGDYVYEKTGSPLLAAAAYSAPTALAEILGAKGASRVLPNGKGYEMGDISAYTQGPSGKQRGIFAGVKSKTADLKQQKAAEELANRGIDRDTIWKETGWFHDVDGQWKYEIDDSGARITPSRDFNQEILDTFKPGGGGAARRKEIAAESREYVAPHEQRSVLESVLEHEGLYEAHPDSRWIGYGRDADKMLGEAHYSPDHDEVIVSHLNRDSLKSPLLHETQHAIQEREGFARGGSPSYLKPDDVRDVVADFERKFSAMPALKKNKAEMSPDEYRDWVLQINAGMHPTGMQGVLYDRYKRLAGEAEARNVQTRLNMTADERRATPPWQTLDVPESELIVRRDGGVAMSQADKDYLSAAIKDEEARLEPIKLAMREELRANPDRRSEIVAAFSNEKSRLDRLRSQLATIEIKESMASRPKAQRQSGAFVKPVGKPFSGVGYHQTDKVFDEFDFSKDAQGTAWFTTDKANFLDPQSSASAASGTGRIMERQINLKNAADFDLMDKYGIGELIDMGFDGALLGGDIQVFDPAAISRL